jgi:hypothetical protein
MKGMKDILTHRSEKTPKEFHRRNSPRRPCLTPVLRSGAVQVEGITDSGEVELSL